MAFRFFPRLRSKYRVSSLRRLLRWSLLLLLVLAVMDVGYLAGIWPAWDLYRKGSIQRSSVIRDYESVRHRHPDWPQLRWNPVPLKTIPRAMIRAVIAAEDSRFYEHDGIDFEAFKKAMEHNLSEKRVVYGASTISQQTAKNLFLTTSRNPLRKWHELWLTIGMERNLTKKRILEHYLNIAEFGRGIYGVDAAARFYWGIPAKRLNSRQAIELAATLPSPVRNNPHTATKAFRRRVKKIRRYF